MYKTQLKTTELGATGLEITQVGFGAWALGGGGDRGWGPQDDEESIAAIHRALEVGVNWIDTAAAYGFGRSERVVGRALAGLAERPYVFTRAGHHLHRHEHRQPIAAFFEVLARMAGAPGAAARPARSGVLTVGTAGSTP